MSELPTIAFVDSGLGFAAYAAALRSLRPDLPLVISLDPDHMPYGPRDPQQVRDLILASAEAARRFEPSAVVVACNTASVHGLEALRAAFEPEIPVIGTVPAIRPAAATGGPVAIWSTAATTSSAYLRGLIDAFAIHVPTQPVAAHGLAEAIERADQMGIDAAISAAAAATSPDTRALVLGCTHYGLVADQIRCAVEESVGRPIEIFDSPEPVARQTLRRLGLSAEPDAPDTGGVRAVLLSGRTGALPAALRAYPAVSGILQSDSGPNAKDQEGTT